MTSRRQRQLTAQLSFEYLLDADRQSLFADAESSHEDQSSLASTSPRSLRDNPDHLIERIVARGVGLGHPEIRHCLGQLAESLEESSA